MEVIAFSFTPLWLFINRSLTASLRHDSIQLMKGLWDTRVSSRVRGQVGLRVQYEFELKVGWSGAGEDTDVDNKRDICTKKKMNEETTRHLLEKQLNNHQVVLNVLN